jgi:hypothetical protein
MKTRWLLVLVACSLLASCEFLRSWAEASEPAPVVPGDGTAPAPAPGNGLPHIGGSDPLDLLVTVLTLMGLAPAARLVGLARPLIAPLILAILGRRKPAVPAPQEPSAPQQ